MSKQIALKTLCFLLWTTHLALLKGTFYPNWHHPQFCCMTQCEHLFNSFLDIVATTCSIFHHKPLYKYKLQMWFSLVCKLALIWWCSWEKIKEKVCETFETENLFTLKRLHQLCQVSLKIVEDKSSQEVGIIFFIVNGSWRSTEMNLGFSSRFMSLTARWRWLVELSQRSV